MALVLAIPAVTGCAESRHSPPTGQATVSSPALSVSREADLRSAVLAGTRTDFGQVPTGAAALKKRCFYAGFRRVLDGMNIAHLMETERESGTPAVAQALNGLAAPVAKLCGGKRHVPELLSAAAALSRARQASTSKTQNGSGVPLGSSLKARPLFLPKAKLPGNFADVVPGECFSSEGSEVGAIGLKGVPGEAALGPPMHPREALAYVSITGGPPRITYLSSMKEVPGSPALAGRAFWVSRDTYQGRILVRGDRIDRPGRLGFGVGEKPADQLLLPRGRREPWGSLAHAIPTGWRVAEVPIRVDAPGCYAIQIDGEGFSYDLTFAVAGG